MSDYEKFKNKFASSLSSIYSASEIQDILLKLTLASEDYDINKKETQLLVIEDTLPSEVKEYLAIKKIEGLSINTLKNYKLFLEKFFSDIKKLPSEVEKRDIVLWLNNYQYQNGVENITLNKYREYICRFFTWAYNEEYIPKNPARTIQPIKFEKKTRPYFTQLELEYLRRACKDLRDLAILEALYSTGCRVSEIINIKLSDIDWERKEITVLGKGNKYGVVYINAKAEVALKEYLESRMDDCEYLFVTSRMPYRKLKKTSFEKIVKEIGKRTKGRVNKDISCHIFRHTTATQALHGGMTIENVSKMLRHSNISTTMIYCEVDKPSVFREHQRFVV